MDPRDPRERLAHDQRHVLGALVVRELARPVSSRRRELLADVASPAARSLGQLAERIRRASAAPSDPASRLHAGCAAYLDHVIEQPQHYQLVFGGSPLTASTPELESAADDGMAALRELVQQAQADGELGPGAPRELATVLWVFLHGLAQLQISGHLHEPRTVDGDVRLDDLLSLGLAALRP